MTILIYYVDPIPLISVNETYRIWYTRRDRRWNQGREGLQLQRVAGLRHVFPPMGGSVALRVRAQVSALNGKRLMPVESAARLYEF